MARHTEQAEPRDAIARALARVRIVEQLRQHPTQGRRHGA